MQRIFSLAVLVLVLFVGSASADPVVGVWKMTKESKAPSGVTAQTITVTTTADGHKWSYDITLNNGRHVALVLLTNMKTGTVTMQSADGKTVGTGHFKKTGDAAWEVETPNHKSTGSISADGKKMTVHQTVPAEGTIVFDKL